MWRPSTLQPSFLTVAGLRGVASDFAVLLILACGQCLAVLTGQIDLSQPALASLCTILLAQWLPGLVGAAVVALLRVGVSVVGAPPQYTQILYGVIILVAVALSIDRSKLPTIK